MIVTRQPGPTAYLVVTAGVALTLGGAVAVIGTVLGLHATVGTICGVSVAFGACVCVLWSTIAYMMAYSSGLKENKMGKCIEWLGFAINHRFGLVMRCLMTCGY